MTIEISHLTRRFGSFTAVDDVSLTVEEGSLTALLGPSGSGKTTVLRMIAGLEVPDAGRIAIRGTDVTAVPARHRNIGFVFQHYALFKHMKVSANIAFPLKVRRWKKDAIRERVNELVRLLRLGGLEDRYPGQLSGGQRQRVALARALAARPSVLLLDEPFSALDARVRDELREWLRGLHDQLHVTSLFVTHDQGEAAELAGRIVIMERGRVAQAGTAAELYSRPGSPFVLNFLGRANALPGEALHGVARIAGLELPFPGANGAAVPVVGYVRPGELTLAAAPSAEAIPVVVKNVAANGLTAKVHLVVEATGTPIVAELDHAARAGLPFEPGDRLFASPRDIRVFARDDAS